LNTIDGSYDTRYHCVLTIGEQGAHYFWNYSFDEIISGLIIPFINKQVIPVKHDSQTGILNLSSVSYVRVYKTSQRLDVDSPLDFRKQLQAGQLASSDCTQEIIETVMAGRLSTETRSTLQNQFAVTQKQVFVIMKFDDPTLDSAYQGVIKPIVKKHGYRPLRIDDIQDSGKITDQIIEEISKSQIVIADLSGETPNCYYEAGFAHAIGKEMIFTIRKNTPIHFDLSVYRFIEWDTESKLRQHLDLRFKSIKKRTAS